MKKELFGTTKCCGKDVYLYTLENKNGLKAQVINYGAILVRMFVPDKTGKVEDVVLGYDNLEDYYSNGSFFGATIAPNANRIAGAAFTIDGVEYKLDANENGNNLHSHFDKATHKQFWDAEEIADNAVKFTVKMGDGELGFPGNKVLSLTYTLTDENELRLDYEGTSDKKTIINPTNHTYFNLAGHASGKILDHTLWLNASAYTPVVAGSIPTGEIAPVKGTPMDFTKAKRVGDEIEADFEQIKLGLGYDHNWVIDNYEEGKLQQIAEVHEPTTGRGMKVFSDLPGVQFYAGNCIADTTGKDGVTYSVRTGLCLETDYFPNSANEPSFPSAVYGPERPYKATTIYQFV